MEDEYNDAASMVANLAERMKADHLDSGTPTTDMLRRDIQALESVAADLRDLLARVEMEVP